MGALSGIARSLENAGHVQEAEEAEIIEGQRAFNQGNKHYLELKQNAAKIAEEEKASPFAKLAARALMQACELAQADRKRVNQPKLSLPVRFLPEWKPV